MAQTYMVLNEKPIRRGDDNLIVAIDGVDISRANSSQMHLDLDHDFSRLAGNVLCGWKENSELFLSIDFWDDTEEARVNKERYESGRMRGMSVELGGRNKDVKRKDRETYVLTKSELVGVASTGHPAVAETGPVNNAADSDLALSQQESYNVPSRFDFILRLSDNDLSLVRGSIQPNSTSEESEMPDLNVDEFVEKLADKLAASNEATNAALVDGLTAAAESIVAKFDVQPESTETVDPNVSASEANKAEIAGIVELAVNHPKYDEAQVKDLHIESLMLGMDVPTFREKLESLAIHPTPTAPNKSEPEGGFNTYRLFTAMSQGRSLEKDASYEHTVSSEIKSKVGSHAPSDAVAIPLSVVSGWQKSREGSANWMLATDRSAVTSQTPDAAAQDMPFFYRGDVPDPLDLVPMLRRVPGSTGDSKLVGVTNSGPQAGDSDVGDAGIPAVDAPDPTTQLLSPKAIYKAQNFTRMADVSLPGLLQAQLNIASAQNYEELNNRIVDFVYSELTGTGETDTVTAAPTAAEILAALGRSFQVKGSMERAVIVSPSTYVSLVQQPLVAAVRALVNEAGDRIMDASVMETNYLGTAGATIHRSLVIVPMDIALKLWGDAVYVTLREREGLYTFSVQSIWSVAILHKSLHQRFHTA